MAIPHLGSAVQGPGAARTTDQGLFGLLGSLSVLIAEWTRRIHVRGTSTEFDDLGDAQLVDIGIHRFARKERWLDCRETSLPADTMYRIIP